MKVIFCSLHDILKLKIMYEEAKPLQSKHIEVANNIAAEIVSNFNAEEQNEIVLQIRNFVIRKRQEMLDETLKKAEFLRETLNRLS